MMLTASLEWRILQGLGSSVVGRLARYKRGSETISAQKTKTSFNINIVSDNNQAFLETELRLLLNWKFLTPKLPQNTYDELQAKLRTLCELLDGVVNLPRSKQGSLGPGEGGDTLSRPVKAYPNLRTLLEYLNGGLESADNKFDLDLVNGPNPRLFIIPCGPKTKEVLDAAHGCNDSLVRLCGNPHASSTPAAHSTACTDIRFRERASKIIEALFEQFTYCKSAHEILLSLSSDDPNYAQSQPTLDLFLSCCSYPNRWQETQCLPYDDRFTVREIENLCMDLQTWKEGSLFQILHEHQGLFSIHDLIPPSFLSGAPIHSLDHLLETGAFLRTDHENFRRSNLFNPRQKKALALKLAHCLMDFFDSNYASPTWDIGKVFLVTPPGSRTQDGLLYVGFTTRNASSPDYYTFGFGDPVMLAFAKLLLEIEEGKKIDLGQCSSNTEQWGRLCERAFLVERAGSGLYVEAIKACLYFHLYLPKDGDPKDALQNVVRERIVSQLETALNPPTVTGGKRRHDDLTPPGDKENRRNDRHPESSILEHVTNVEAQPSTDDSLPHPSKKQRVVSLSMSKIINEIVSINTGDVCTSAFKFDVKDITRSSSEIGTRGTALIEFHGPVPERFRTIMQSSESSTLVSDGASMEVDTKFIGATQLYEPSSEATADIVAIHGLNGHPYGSWLSKSANPRMWLYDFLPEDAPNCRIIIYGYKSNIFDEKTHPRHELFTQAERLNATLNNIRNTAESARRPLIFLAHSYGGLVLARALTIACLKKGHIHDATIALFLFACPTRGFHAQDILDAMRAEQQAAGEDPIADDKAEALVRRLGDGDFRNELSSFPDVIKGKKVYTFSETRRTQTVTRKVRRDGDAVMAAGPNSVILGLPGDIEEVIPADKDHSDIVKFASRGDETYEDIKCRIQSLVSNLPQKLACVF
ncbi:hypothetical protein Egran_06701 [Elaphomyces granulatus]|uniref:DUF7580 domain-containing protein n=1 Tax=Elaphomyces granulatus TaxID=519963 RepID=A0A232LMZ5_9EURO|nr:hypothetical protein Egran_06701 [Elaphomyces granulatus]